MLIKIKSSVTYARVASASQLLPAPEHNNLSKNFKHYFGNTSTNSKSKFKNKGLKVISKRVKRGWKH